MASQSAPQLAASPNESASSTTTAMTVPLSSPSLPTLPALKKFDLFPKLPLEMRFIIWACWFLAPRTVEIERSEDIQGWFCPKESDLGLCKLLAMCQESRQLFLKKWLPLAHYKSGVIDIRRDPTSRTDRSPITLFNPKQDKLFIAYSDDHLCFASPSPMKALVAKGCIQELRFLALDFNILIPGGHEDNIKMINFILEKMPKLKSLALICGNPSETCQGQKQYYLGAITFMDQCSNNPISRGNAQRAKEVENINAFCQNGQLSSRNLLVEYKHIVRGTRKMPY